ncbi:MAG: B12-binding protein [bacterium]|nr:MAG: B12-binding protein [bacterium]
MTKHPYEKWLDRVTKPSQYVGNEVHSVIKNREEVDCRLALCFPEPYGIGMSHLGMKILYHVVNRRNRLWAERFFVPEPDMEKILVENGEFLRSLESRDPLKDFDIVGFSITTELSYTGILSIMDLGGIPVRRVDRREEHPIVIGGGAAVYNPEPLADFFDLFVLGEAEQLLPDLMERFAALKNNGLSKKEILRKLARIDGIYVPSLFDVSYDGASVKDIKSNEPDVPRPTRVFLEDLADSPFPIDMVIPYGQPVFDRIAVEIDRGCTQACRFCQAGFTYRPVRERSVETILEIIEKGLKSTGLDEVSLASLSSGDYSGIEPLVKSLMDATACDRVSISLPSLRSGTLTSELVNQINRVRKTGFTITVEAGSERLRRFINKKISDEEFLQTAQNVLAGGRRHLKLYFMIGLTTETGEDIEEIIRIVEKIRSLRHDGKCFSKINVGVSQFVPKPHTPFQWTAMDSPEKLLEKKLTLLSAFKRMKNVFLKGHDVEMSFIESAFARGDRRLGAVILNAYGKGCRLDNWTDFFRYDLWLKAFADEGLKPDDFALRERAKYEILPWEHIDIGVSKKYLRREFSNAQKEKITDDCRFGECSGCGIDPCNMVIKKQVEIERPLLHLGEKSDTSVRFRYRASYRKESLARYLSHLEMLAAFSRAIRRAGLPVAFSRGIHPRQKLSFGAALSVGVGSRCEMFDIELKKQIPPDEIMKKLNSELEAGIVLYSVEPMHTPYNSIQQQFLYSSWEITDFRSGAQPSLSEVKKTLESMENIKAPELYSDMDKGVEVLKFKSYSPGVLSKLKNELPEFALSENRRMNKVSSIMKPHAKVVA